MDLSWKLYLIVGVGMCACMERMRPTWCVGVWGRMDLVCKERANEFTFSVMHSALAHCTWRWLHMHNCTSEHSFRWLDENFAQFYNSIKISIKINNWISTLFPIFSGASSYCCVIRTTYILFPHPLRPFPSPPLPSHLSPLSIVSSPSHNPSPFLPLTRHSLHHKTLFLLHLFVYVFRLSTFIILSFIFWFSSAARTLFLFPLEIRAEAYYRYSLCAFCIFSFYLIYGPISFAFRRNWICCRGERCKVDVSTSVHCTNILGKSLTPQKGTGRITRQPKLSHRWKCDESLLPQRYMKKCTEKVKTNLTSLPVLLLSSLWSLEISWR